MGGSKYVRRHGKCRRKKKCYKPKKYSYSDDWSNCKPKRKKCCKPRKCYRRKKCDDGSCNSTSYCPEEVINWLLKTSVGKRPKRPCYKGRTRVVAMPQQLANPLFYTPGPIPRYRLY